MSSLSFNSYKVQTPPQDENSAAVKAASPKDLLKTSSDKGSRAATGVLQRKTEYPKNNKIISIARPNTPAGEIENRELPAKSLLATMLAGVKKSGTAACHVLHVSMKKIKNLLQNAPSQRVKEFKKASMGKEYSINCFVFKKSISNHTSQVLDFDQMDRQIERDFNGRGSYSIKTSEQGEIPLEIQTVDHVKNEITKALVGLDSNLKVNIKDKLHITTDDELAKCLMFLATQNSFNTINIENQTETLSLTKVVFSFAITKDSIKVTSQGEAILSPVGKMPPKKATHSIRSEMNLLEDDGKGLTHVYLNKK
jgi:hypothetical protein